MPWFSDDADGGSEIRIPGLYSALFERERERDGSPDPRWKYSDRGRRGDPPPPEWIQRSPLLADLESGEPVELPRYQLGGQTDSGGQLRRLLHADRRIVGWMVYSDDTVVPIREGGVG